MHLRSRLGIFVAALLVAACATAPAAPAANSSPNAAPSTPAPATSAQAAFPVTITDAYGSVTINAEPKRVVVLADEMAEIAVALGIQPVGLGSTRIDTVAAGDPFTASEYYLTEAQIGQPVFVGGQEPNLETVASLQPDLILYLNYDAAVYEQLGQIAPTLAFNTTARGGWKQALTAIGAATNRSAQAQSVIAEFDGRLREAQNTLAPVVATHPRIMLLYPEYRGSDQNFVFSDEFALAGTLTDLGFTLVGTANGEAVEGGVFLISPELYPTVETDTVIVLGPAERRTTSSTPILDALDVPVLHVGVEDGRPSTGPLSERYYLDSYADVLLHTYGTVAPTTATPEATGDDAPAAAGALQVLQETDNERLIRHSLGEARVPRDPQRIVTLQDQNALLPLLELGVQNVVGSVGYTSENGQPIFRRTNGYDTANIEYVGEYGEPNLEAVAALQPDLIVGGQYEITPENYDLLAQIAPTVVVEQFTRPVWDVMDDLALLTTTQQAAVDLKTRYHARVNEIKAKLVDPSAITLSIITPYNAEFYFDASDYDTGVVVARDLGITIPALHEQAIAQGDYPTYSIELLPQADGDVLFILDYSAEGQATEYVPDNVRNGAVFGTLNAVQKNQAFIIDPARMGGVSYGGLFGMLDAVEEHMTTKPIDTTWEPPT